MKTYELWRERKNGEVWAVHLVDGAVVGCRGPLAVHDCEPRFLSSLDYTPERAEWIDAHRDAFDLAEPPEIGALSFR